jgi:hypothetical protein
LLAALPPPPQACRERLSAARAMAHAARQKNLDAPALAAERAALLA